MGSRRSRADSDGDRAPAGAASAPMTSIRACSRSAMVFLVGPVNDDHVANLVVAQLLFLEVGEPWTRTSASVHQFAGRRRSRRGWRSTTPCSSSSRTCQHPVHQARHASMGAFLLMAGAKGKRFCAAQLAGDDPPADPVASQGQASDIEIHAQARSSTCKQAAE
jgi:ATP-dependent Clp protease protease subunit